MTGEGEQDGEPGPAASPHGSTVPDPGSRLDRPSVLDRRVSAKAVLAAGVVIGAIALVVTAVVLFGSGDDPDVDTAGGTAAPATATTTATTEAGGGAGQTDDVVLLPDGLGVVDFGASPTETFAALTEALGEPDAPVEDVGGPNSPEPCVGSAAGGVQQAQWDRLLVSASAEEGFFLWRFDVPPSIPDFPREDSDLTTPEAIGQESTLADFEAAYGPLTIGQTTFDGDLLFSSQLGHDFAQETLTSSQGYEAAAFAGEVAFFGAFSVDPAGVCSNASGAHG